MISEHNPSVTGRRPGGLARPGGGRHGRRALVPGLAVAAAALIAACGGPGGIYGTGGGSAGGAPAGMAHHAAASHGAVISARTLPGAGTVLVGRSGKTLYSPQQEAHGMIMCTGGCLSFWFPVSVAAGTTPHAPTGVTGVLGTIHRPDDGLTQLTYNGTPLYTFRLGQPPRATPTPPPPAPPRAPPPPPATPPPPAEPRPAPPSRAMPVATPPRAAHADTDDPPSGRPGACARAAARHATRGRPGHTPQETG